jgi:prepilin-type processing-associated H-X9-DG protein
VLTATILGQAGDAPAGKGGPKQAPPELAFIPPDAGVVIRMRVADLWKSEGFKVLAQLIPGGFDKMSQSFIKEMKPEDLEVVTVAAPSFEAFGGGGNPFRPAPGAKGSDGEMVILLTVKRPELLAEMRQGIETSGKEHKVKDRTYYTNPDEEGMAVHFSGDRTVVMGSTRTVVRGLGRTGAARGSGLYAGALAEALPRNQLVVGLKITGKESGVLLAPFGVNDRKARRIFRPLDPMNGLLVTLDFGKESRATLRLFFPDRAQAEKALPAVQDVLVMLRLGLGAEAIDRAETTLAESLDRAEVEKAQYTLLCLEGLERVLRRARVEVKGESVEVTMQTKADFAAVKAMAKALARKRLSGEKEQEGRKRKASENNLKQIGLACHSFYDVYKILPPQAICSKDGKPLLSWRVAILPYLEQQALYQKFKLDEPWDSPHNKKLLAEMPKVYAPVGVMTKEPHTTYYQGFNGPGAVFELRKSPEAAFHAVGLRLLAVRDGTSNTLLVVEAGQAVPWTKPEDIRYAPGRPLPKLGGLFKGGFHAAFCDGHVQFLRRQLNEQTLRALITHSGGEVIPEIDE